MYRNKGFQGAVWDFTVDRENHTVDKCIYQKLGFADIDIAENFNIGNIVATTPLFHFLYSFWPLDKPESFDVTDNSVTTVFSIEPSSKCTVRTVGLIFHSIIGLVVYRWLCGL